MASPTGEDATQAEDSRRASNSGIAATPISLSASKIIDLLGTNPEMVVELKQQVADGLQQQGAQVDANDISDQMLYAQIASSADLRVSITLFLRARGYVTDDDLALGNSDTEDAVPRTTESGGPHLPSDGNDTNPAMLHLGRDSLADAGGGGDQDGLGSRMTSPRSARPLNETKRREESVNTSTDVPQVLHRSTPYNLRSLRDLYTQVPDRTPSLKRYGSEVFLNRDGAALTRGLAGQDASLDVPLDPDYVVGPGDSLRISISGGVSQIFARTIERNGQVALPEAGAVQIAGFTLERAEAEIEGALRRQYRDARVAVTVARLRSVRIYVVGDVQRPGAYDISSLATPISALYAAGGPTAAGSLRIARHLRGDKLIEEADLYDFLIRGLRISSARFESGDTLQVPAAGVQVALSGAIKHPAIYELKAAETLGTLIDDAGGLTAAASFDHITVDRIQSNTRRETISLPASEGDGGKLNLETLRAFALKDGDRIRIDPILPYSERAIYVEGHVARPGRMPYTEGMRLSDVLRSYRDVLPEPSSHGEIVRLVQPDLHAENIEFNVPDVLIGNTNLNLRPFDTIRIFGRYETDAPKVTIRGEVLRPGVYPLSAGMTAAQLVRMAGGFKRDALLEIADLTSYGIVNGNKVEQQLATIHIGAAVSGSDSAADVPLKAGDVVSVHQITGWNDIGQSITLLGQIKYPGSYGFKEGERLSSVLRRAGGLLPMAYPMGAVLVRDQVRELEQKSREELIRQIQTNSAAARVSPNLGGGDTGGTLQLIKAQQEQVLADLKSHPPTGRMVIHISADIESWANTTADVELRQGDVLTVPKQPGFVLVTGQVYNATALSYSDNKTAGWYLSRAGGTNTAANRREIFVIRANGSVIGRHSGGWFDGDVLSTKLNPGDVVVVPQKIIGASLFWRNLLTTAQLASSVAITAAVAGI
jgi:protein involved in polysaccharide export with SLBB domain